MLCDDATQSVVAKLDPIQSTTPQRPARVPRGRDPDVAIRVARVQCRRAHRRGARARARGGALAHGGRGRGSAPGTHRGPPLRKLRGVSLRARRGARQAHGRRHRRAAPAVQRREGGAQLASQAAAAAEGRGDQDRRRERARQFQFHAHPREDAHTREDARPLPSRQTRIATRGHAAETPAVRVTVASGGGGGGEPFDASAGLPKADSGGKLDPEVHLAQKEHQGRPAVARVQADADADALVAARAGRWGGPRSSTFTSFTRTYIQRRPHRRARAESRGGCRAREASEDGGDHESRGGGDGGGHGRRRRRRRHRRGERRA